MNQPHNSRKVVLGGAAMLFVAALFLLSSHFTGKRALEKWKQQMKLRGENFTVAELAPPPGPQNDTNLDEIELATGRLRARGIDPSGFEVIDFTRPGRAQPTWEETEIAVGRGKTVGWPLIRQEMEAADDDLSSICAALINPACASAVDYDDPTVWKSYYQAERLAAGWLSGSTLYELHEGHLTKAQQRLAALTHLVRLHKDDLRLVNQMIRVAIAGLVFETTWAALQAPGWTEITLSELQRDWDAPQMLEKYALTLEMDRAKAINWFACSRTNGLKSVRPQFVLSAGATQSMANVFRDYLIEPAWRLAWSESDELFFLQGAQLTLETTRRALRHKSNRRLASDLTRSDRKSAAAMTLFDTVRFQMSQIMSQNWTRARECIMQAETQRSLVVAAIAIQRYHLRYQRPPPSLDALVPEFMNSVPVDYMDGQPLRYRRESDGGFRLYSVGLNGRDDGGDPAPVDWLRDRLYIWRACDAIWPGRTAYESRPAPPDEVLQLVGFKDANLVDVIKVLSRQVGLKVLFDPRIDAATLSQAVNLRLENVTAKDVLAAVLANYDLFMVEHSGRDFIRITTK